MCWCNPLIRTPNCGSVECHRIAAQKAAERPVTPTNSERDAITLKHIKEGVKSAVLRKNGRVDMFISVPVEVHSYIMDRA